jgi:hypothetical protein
LNGEIHGWYKNMLETTFLVKTSPWLNSADESGRLLLLVETDEAKIHASILSKRIEGCDIILN